MPIRSLTIALLLATAAAPRAQTPQTTWTLPVVMARAATYVESYAGSLSGMVVEESYVQDVQGGQAPNPIGRRINLSGRPVHRELKSDVLLVRSEGADTWMQFRDVFEVDGTPVHDRNNRLAEIFLRPSKSSSAQAERIVKESARYNIGDVERTINMPVLALTVLDPRVQAGFQFEQSPPVGNRGTLPNARAFIPATDALVIGFRETAVRTIIVSPQGTNMPSSGRFWLAMPSAQVLMSELRVENFSLSAAIHVAYQPRPGFSVPVPVEMHEVYVNRLNNSRIEGSAIYTNFREFKVKTDEAVAPPARPDR